MKVEVTGPSEFQGAIIQQLTRRNGIILGTDESEGFFTVVCEVRFAREISMQMRKEREKCAKRRIGGELADMHYRRRFLLRYPFASVFAIRVPDFL